MLTFYILRYIDSIIKNVYLETILFRDYWKLNLPSNDSNREM